MKINIVIIDKKGKDQLYAPLVEHFKKIAKPFAQINVVELFDKEIAKAQDISPLAAQASYSRALKKQWSPSYTIALNPSSRELDSFEFAKLLKDRAQVNFFIGGAYGLEEDFVSQCNTTISLGKITLSHKLVKVVLMEQIFRGLSINHNHPYHK
ncbi:MAG: 23S rRNA (pseudouridine(1915)-N(3))-methyltransferase RlmH [Epsilonproteobacteria bacterium]|nr:MAG: 23S rRNA (pseudouridine(1915)-N(3))-methyltransferase RlmH [Campylobacterota bacterium]